MRPHRGSGHDAPLATLRRNLGALAVDNFFRGALTIGKLHPLSRPDRHGVEVLRDIPYGTAGHAHLLDVYRPRDATGPMPAVLYIHGGAFRILSKDTHWIMALAFARAGYVVFNINYRLAPRHPFPAALEDAAAALEWVAQHGAEYGADPARIAFAGESAGGNLVSALTLATCFERDEPFARRAFDTGIVPRAWLPYCGVLDVSDLSRFRRRWPDMSAFIHDRLVETRLAYLGAEPARHGAMLDFADPVRWLEGEAAPDRPLPPCFAMCGTADPLIDDTQRLEKALGARGTACEVHYYPGELHAFHAMVWRKNARHCWTHTFRFLERHM